MNLIKNCPENMILLIICILALTVLIYILERRINKLYTIIKTLTVFGFQNEWIYLSLFGISKRVLIEGTKRYINKNNVPIKIPNYIDEDI